MHKYNEQHLAGVIYKPASDANRIPTVDGFKQIRELTAVRDKLHKEIDKLETRNDDLAQKNKKLINTNFSQQRDIQILRNMNDKIWEEKNKLSSEYEKCKEQRDKLECHFARLGDSIQLQAQIESLKQQIDSLNNDLYRSQNTIKDKEDANRKLTEEINALNIALDNHVHYDRGGKSASKNNGTLSREVLRDMCYNMAKKEAELHTMSLTLAEIYGRLENALKENDELTYDKETIKLQLDEALQRFDIVEEALEKEREEKTALQDMNSKLRDTQLRNEKIMEDLGFRNTKSRNMLEEATAELSVKTADMKALQDEHQNVVHSLKNKLESMQVAMSHKDSVMAMCEQRLSHERDQLRAERETMRDKLQRVDYLEHEIEIIRSRSQVAAENNDVEIQQLKSDLLSVRTENENYRREVSSMTEKCQLYNKAMQEQAMLSDALRDAMSTSNALKSKLQHELKRRETAEAAAAAAEQAAKTIEEKLKFAEQSKSQYSFAVLDAYQQEREKNAILEKELNVLRSIRTSLENNRQDTPARSMSQGMNFSADSDQSGLQPSPPRMSSYKLDETAYHSPLKESPQKRVDSNIAATHDVAKTLQRLRTDLNRVITETSNSVETDPNEDLDRTVYYPPDDADRAHNDSTSSDDLNGLDINTPRSYGKF